MYISFWGNIDVELWDDTRGVFSRQLVQVWVDPYSQDCLWRSRVVYRGPLDQWSRRKYERHVSAAAGAVGGGGVDADDEDDDDDYNNHYNNNHNNNDNNHNDKNNIQYQ